MITYEPFFKTLKAKRISTYKLINDMGFSRGTLDSLHQNRNVTMNTINDICEMLDCEISDVVKFVKGDSMNEESTSEESKSEEPTSEEPTSEESTSEESIKEDSISEEFIREEPIKEDSIREDFMEEETQE